MIDKLTELGLQFVALVLALAGPTARDMPLDFHLKRGAAESHARVKRAMVAPAKSMKTCSS